MLLFGQLLLWLVTQQHDTLNMFLHLPSHMWNQQLA